MKKSSYLFVSIVLLLSVFACKSGKKDTKMISENKQPAVYEYADGSGNAYIVTRNTIEYKPIKPRFSSSGDYDGGKAVKKSITAAQYSDVKMLIDVASVNKEAHILNRVKGSGLVIISIGDISKTKFILSSGSKEKALIEALLKKLVK